MSLLFEMYNGILQKIETINADIESAEKRISAITDECGNTIPQRIINLQEQLKKIDDYMLKIKAFRKLAEKNMESKNILTIEAPPGYRINLNRLRQWAMMIDPMSSDDPYAQRVYITSMCDECFLNKKKVEFSERIEQLKNDRSVGLGEEIQRLERDIEKNRNEIRSILSGSDMKEFAEKVRLANSAYWYETAPAVFADADSRLPYVAPGAYAMHLNIPEDFRADLKAMLGKFYDETTSRILMPVEMDTEKEFALSVLCAPGRSKMLDRAVQNLILNIMEKYPAGQNKIYILDGVRFNSSVLGSLKQLESSFAIAPVPRTPEQLSAALEEIVSGFSDIDDIIDLHDSVIEYNREQPDDKKVKRTTVILFGWPNSYDGRDKEYLHRIMTNYERYGISFVSVSYLRNQKEDENRIELPEYAAINAVRICMKLKSTTITIGDDPALEFTWYTLSGNLPLSYIESLRNVKIIKKEATSVYPEIYDCVSMPDYVRSYKKLELPFGIDGKGNVHSVSFENENFAAYLVGASRSGKSTLLHTLIAGIVRNYHPDNVELWLADFKQLEFKKYIEHCPPHVKYVLLDESTELVYDLIDKLTEKMMERQRLFARLGKERIDQIDPIHQESPLPLIFVILDEFSIMSQSIAESDIYRLKLQNLLAKGAALGIRFLFSSQTFTTGIAGLTPTARAQIQQRIAMKGTREEISETLELSVNLKTEQVRNWMDALPPHYALVKHRTGADTPPQVNRMLVMYFPDHGMIDSMIDRINASMTKSREYKVSDVNSYVNKKAVFVDGNSYHAFPKKGAIWAAMAAEKKKSSFTGEEMFMALGVPRLMSKLKLVMLSRETRENILFIGRMMEQDCSASVLTSAIRSFLMQSGKVCVWAYGKNSLYQKCRTKAWHGSEYAGITYAEDMEEICAAIQTLKEKIQKRQVGNELIVLTGMDRICADFEFADMQGAGSGKIWSGLDPGLEVSTPEEERLWRLTLEDSNTDGSEDRTDNRDEGQETDRMEKHDDGKEESLQEIQPASYNAGSDLQYIVMQGSRLGYHFLLFLNSFADLKTTALRLDWFRHRMAFQIPIEDSMDIFHNKTAGKLPEHVCQYYDMMSRHSFRPYLQQGIGWDGWEVGEDGQAVNLYE